MPTEREIRADWDRETVVVYQAYSDAIADPALREGRFVAPFSFGRMTWIKPGFLWLMARSSFGTSPGQERVLGVRITRAGWEEALSLGVLTSFVRSAHGDAERWRTAFDAAEVHVQWDPERSLGGKKLDHRAIQVGVGRTRIERYVRDWIVSLVDWTPKVRTMREHLRRGDTDRARRLLPPERPYPVSAEVGRRLGIPDRG